MRIHEVDYGKAAGDIRKVRDAVFVQEQRVSVEAEYDDRDAICRHVVVYDQGEAIGTGRIDFGRGGKVGRVAVLAEARRRGAGRMIMSELESIARTGGIRLVWCHAQTRAVPFYRKLGYYVEGEEFIEADIPHVVMKKDL